MAEKTDILVTNARDAVNNRHTHTNKLVLDQITQDKVDKIEEIDNIQLVPEQVIVNGLLAENIPYELRRIKIGGILYLYRFNTEESDGGMIPAGDHVIGTVEDFPELSEYQFSATMGEMGKNMTSTGVVTQNPDFSLQITPVGICIHVPGPSAVTLFSGQFLIADSVRCPMGRFSI